jgi:hypothetical protein
MREGAPTFRGRGRGDRGVRGSIGSRRRGKKTPTLGSKGHSQGGTRRRGNKGSACLTTIRRSVRECRETLGPPVVPHGAQDSVGCPRSESCGASWERARYGYTQYHSGGRSRSDASRALPASRSQGLVAEKPSRALARRKLEAPPDAGHEPREGETVRGIALTIKSTCWFGLWVKARRFSIRRKVFSGSCPLYLHR